MDISFHQSSVSNIAVKNYTFDDQLQQLPLKLSNDWSLLGLRMVLQTDGSKELIQIEYSMYV